MNSKTKWTIRLFMYFGGLFIMTVGIAISVKSNLGTAPVSSIPYTMTCVWGIEMGKATMMFHAMLVGIQILLYRKAFKIKNLLQILVGVVFGYFTTFCNYLMSFLPDVENMPIRIIMLLISATLIALGLFFYVPADIMPIAAEGTIGAIADKTNQPFPRVKVEFDVTVVAISVIVCFIALGNLASVGVGTVIAAVFVGTILSYIVKFFGKWRAELLRKIGLQN